MVFRTVSHRISQVTSRYATLSLRGRQFLGGVLFLGLGACTSAGPAEDLGKVGFVQGFLGGVAADEPRATLIGRDILSSGGTAADAITAMYFTASVTMPVAAGLGGGGVCVYHDAESDVTEALDFMIRTPDGQPAEGQRAVGIPLNARGFFVLQNRYGALRWAQLISPAENLARFGTPMSRALRKDLAALTPILSRSPQLGRTFATPQGQLLAEGDVFKQFDLAATLTELRTKGPGVMHSGAWATRYLEAVQAIGGYLPADQLRNAVPVWRDTIKSQPYNYQVAHFAPQPAGGGTVSAQMWSQLAALDAFKDASTVERSHQLAETAMRAFGDQSRWFGQESDEAISVSEEKTESLLQGYSAEAHQAATSLPVAPVNRPQNPSAFNLVALDRFGSVASCTVTLNNPLGVGQVAAGSGVVIAAAEGKTGRGSLPLTPMVVVNPNTFEAYYGGSATGGAVAPTALMSVFAHMTMGGEDIETAMNKPRIHHNGMPDQLFHNGTLSEEDENALKALGYEVGSLGPFGSVAAFACPDGVEVEPDSCRIMIDPQSAGLALGAE